MVGLLISERALVLELLLGVLRDRILPRDALGDLPVQLGKFPMFQLQQLCGEAQLVACQLS